MQKLSSIRRAIPKTLFAAALVGLSGPIAIAQPTIRSVGAMQDVNKVSVRFNGPIDSNSIATVNFAVSGATVTNAEMQLNHSATVVNQIKDAVLLSLTAPITGAHTLNAAGVKDLGGTTMAPVTGQAFTVSDYRYVQNGAPFYDGSATPYGADGFDIENYGWANEAYTGEESFVYVQKAGDFDFKMHIASYAYLGRYVQWGIMAREGLDEHVPEFVGDPANNERNPYHRLVNVLAWNLNMAIYVDGTNWAIEPARDRYEAVYRQEFGNTLGNAGSFDFPPRADGGGSRWNRIRPSSHYPDNVWFRLRRLGNTFYGYMGTDGVTWDKNNFCPDDFTMPGCSNVMYVGFFAVGNIGDHLGNVAGSPVAPRFPGDGTQNAGDPVKVDAFRARGLHGFFDNLTEIPWPAVAIVTQPVPVTNIPNASVTFTVAATGGDLPLTYQWYKGVNPIGGATASSYNISSVQLSDDADYKVVVSNGKFEQTSTVVHLTVTADTIMPTVTSLANGFTDKMLVIFSEPVNAATIVSGNFILAGGRTVTGAAISGNANAVLTLSGPLTGGNPYTLTIQNVQDYAGNAILQTNLAFTAMLRTVDPTFGTHMVGDEIYKNIAGATVASLTGSAKYINGRPDLVLRQDKLVGPTDYDDAYGQKMYGHVVPPVSGNYVFFISSDNQSDLYLSPDSSPAKKVKIASVNTGTTPKQWDLETNQKSAPVALLAGIPYYFEALQKESGSEDNLAIAWLKPGDAGAFPGSTDADCIGGNALIDDICVAYDPSQSQLTITDPTAPASYTVPEHSTFVLKVAANGTSSIGNALNHQWFKGGSPYLDGLGNPVTTSNLTLVNVQPTDAGVYTCKVALPTGESATSPALTVQTVVDNAKPTVVKASGSDTFTEVNVQFSEAVQDFTGQTTFFTITDTNGANPLTVQQATATADFTGAILVTDVQTEGRSYKVTVTGISDLAGNVIAPPGNTANFTAFMIAKGYVKVELNTGQGDFTVTIANAYNSTPNQPIHYLHGDLDYSLGADFYFTRLSGIFTAPQAGTYYFWGCADLAEGIWVSSDQTLAGLPPVDSPVQIQANPAQYVPSGDWHTWGLDINNALYPSTGVVLTAGERRYVVANAAEFTGTDWLNVKWVRDNASPPASGSPASSAADFGFYVDPDASVLDITASPVSVTTRENNCVLFTAAATGTSSLSEPPWVQWFRNDVAIPGANGNELLVVAEMTNNQAQYHAAFNVPLITKVTTKATLTVTPSTLPPDLFSMPIVVNDSDPLDKGSATELVKDKDIDVIGGGSDLSGIFDAGRFIFAQVNGDFDQAVRVNSLEFTSNEAQAALMARESLAKESKAIQIAVRPQLGVNAYELTARERISQWNAAWPSGLTGASLANPWPNAWMRLKRVGEVFTCYRSADGVTWTSLGSRNYINGDGSAIFPRKMFVGLAASSHNNTPPDQAALAEFRDYNRFLGQAQPTLTWTRVANGIELTYANGRLQSADLVDGPWADVAPVSNPYPASTATGTKFFRVAR